MMSNPPIHLNLKGIFMKGIIAKGKQKPAAMHGSNPQGIRSTDHLTEIIPKAKGITSRINGTGRKGFITIRHFT
jgi:hypothetical protein